MSTLRTHRWVSSVLCLLVWSGVDPGLADEIDSQWICHTGTGNYSTPACWDPGLDQAPFNRGSLQFNVSFPVGKGTILSDIALCVVNSLTLRKGTTLEVPSGNTFSVTGSAELYGNVKTDGEFSVPGQAAIYGYVRASGGSFIAVNAAFPGNGAQLWAGGGGTIVAGASAFSATGLNAHGTDYTLLSSDGDGSLLNLSAIKELDDSVSIPGGAFTHTVISQQGGTIDFSGLRSIVGPAEDDALNITVSFGTIDMSSLETISGSPGSVNFVIANGGTLLLGDVDARVGITLSLNHPEDVLELADGIDLGTTIAVSNPGDAMLFLGGDFSYRHTDATKAPFGHSTVFFTGKGQQKFEVGGYDLRLFVRELRNDNFGLGQMRIVGAPDQPSTVLLVDQIDNGSRESFFGDAECLYLFGKGGQDGLRIFNGSTLYMNHLHVYALLNGTMTDLRDLFGQDETFIEFDDGYLCLGGPEDDPRGLTLNGGFETGLDPVTHELPVRSLPEGSLDIDNWEVTQSIVDWTHESQAPDGGPGERYVILRNEETSNGSLRQELRAVLGQEYHVYFDTALLPVADEKIASPPQLMVSVADVVEGFSIDHLWQKESIDFVADQEALTLSFASQGGAGAGSSLAIDNVAVLPYDREITPVYRLRLSVGDGGSVTISPDNSEPMLIPGPSEITLRYNSNQAISLTAEANDAWQFIGWEGLAKRDHSISTSFVMDNDMSLEALFGNRNVLTTSVDTSNCPHVQSSAIVTDLNQEPVIGLSTMNFIVFEDGEPRPLLAVEQSACPISFSLVMDYSGSMMTFESIDSMEAAAEAFVGHMTQKDYGQIIKFSTQAEIMVDFTNDMANLNTAIRAPFENGETLLFDAIHLAISELSGQSGCQAVVAMTDGRDTVSGHTLQDVIVDAQLQGIPVFTINLVQTQFRDEKAEADMKRIAEETGGLYRRAEGNDQLEDVYNSIAQILKNQYLLTYESSACHRASSLGSEHELEIRVRGDAFFGRALEMVGQPSQ